MKSSSNVALAWPDNGEPAAVVAARGRFLEAWDALRFVVLACDPLEDDDALKRLIDATADVVRAKETIRYTGMVLDDDPPSKG